MIIFFINVWDFTKFNVNHRQLKFHCLTIYLKIEYIGAFRIILIYFNINQSLKSNEIVSLNL